MLKIIEKVRVAIIGAGPAGIYAADLLLKAGEENGINFSIDLFEQLPAPYGLVRYGVSPDHPRIKGVIGALRGILDRGEIRLFGNVRYGEHLLLEDLKKHYHAAIFATGAIRDTALNLAGVDAKGSYGAADFVSWFDGHPDVPRTWPLEAKNVAVIGNGNVALDVTRMLTKNVTDLMSTEIPENVEEGLRKNPLKELHLFGRRGPGAVKFTPLELRELGEVRGVEIVLNPADFEVEDTFAEEEKERNKQLVIIGRIFDQWLEKQKSGENDEDPARKIFMHFWSNPVEFVEADGAITGIKVERTSPDGKGGAEGTGEITEIPVQAIYRAVGYLSDPAAEVPFDSVQGVISNIAGRVTDAAGEQVPGLYATGWIKRGPVGLIGATKSDAAETVNGIVEDISRLWQPETTDETAIVELLNERGIKTTDLTGWQRLDEHELALGEASGRERIKVVSREEMTEISRAEASKE